jgi:hypothetical protein
MSMIEPYLWFRGIYLLTRYRYYTLIHPAIPMLPHSKARLRSRLANCPITLRESFLAALYTTIRSNPSSKAYQKVNLRQTIDTLTASQFENAATRTLSTNLIYLATLVFTALESDNHGPVTLTGQVGPPRAAWLGSAIGVACHMKLHLSRYTDQSVSSDTDSDESFGRRIWWSLVTMDRWHSCSTSSPMLIPDSCVVVLPSDQTLLGQTAYHLASMYFSIAGIIRAVFQTNSFIQDYRAL